VDRLLNENEKIIWSGKPVKKAFVLPALGSVPFGLFFLGFSIFFLLGVSSTGAPGLFTIFPLLFVAIAIGLTFGPSLWQLLRYRNTEYVITDRRIITQTGAVGLDTRFVEFEKIQEVFVKIGVFDRLFGTGSVYIMTAGSSNFNPSTGPYTYGFGGMYGFRPNLAALKDPYDVERLLQEAVERKRTNKSSMENVP
jgi:membrane protein YdbS with pleckstrin-like domain